ncbi:glycosyltransferase family 4 protein [bacterium]|nr:glycosyltransferase family 4 protein [bacterium]
MSAVYGIGLLCTTHSLGGIELNVLRFARWMRARGHRVLIIGSSGSPMLQIAQDEEIPAFALGTPRKYGDLGAARRLLHTLREHQLDILQLNTTRDLNLGILTRALSRDALKLVHVQHMQFGGTKTDLLHRLQHARLSAWVAPLPSLAEQTRENTTIHPDRIHIIPFGIDLTQFKAMPDGDMARKQYGLKTDVPVVGTVGRLDRGKGQEFLFRAAALLREQGTEVQLLIVGEDTRAESQEYGSMLRDLAAKLAIADAVTFAGFASSVVPAYAAMDVFALTSLSETYGMVTIEAMAAGLPVVGSDSGGTPEILQHGMSGLLVPPRDPQALSEALARLLGNPDEQLRLGVAARTHANKAFSHYAQCSAYEKLYATIGGASEHATTSDNPAS